MRRRAAVTVGALVGALLAVAPSAAQADEPSVRTSGDDVVYTDPGLADADTTRVRGVLREVVTEPADATAGDHPTHDHADAQPLVVLADGTHVPVALDLDDAVADALGAPVVAELVDGPTLDAALDGTATEPVAVQSARVDTAQAATVPAPHRVYTAVVGNSGTSPVDADATIQARVDAGTRWWSDESGTTFSTASTVRYDSALDATGRCGFANPWTLWSEAARQFPAGTFDQAGNHLLVVVDGTCQGTGVGTVGRGMADGGSSTQTENPSVFTATFAHEVGHNVGLQHANLDARDGQGGEYWDLYSPMGLAISGQGLDPTALDTEYRSQLGILDTGEVEVVGTGTSVTRSLVARGSGSGLRGLEVRSADGTSHWVEYRDGGGRDARSYYRLEPNASVSGTRKYLRGVTVSTRATGSTGSTLLRPRADGTVAHGSRQAGQTYTAGDVVVRVDAVGTDGATVTVTNGPVLQDLQTSAPVVEGEPRVGATLTARPGSWTSGTAFAYQWLADGTPLAGETAQTFTPSAAQVGRRVTVQVTGSRSGYRSATRTSDASGAVAAGTLSAATPTVDGSARVGVQLTASAGTWTSGTSFAYQWSAGGTVVPGATARTFTPGAAQRGAALTVTVTGTKDGYTTASRTSDPTAPVAAGATAAGTPVVAGSPQVGRTLTLDRGTWPSGTSFSQQWLADGAVVAGATDATFTPGPAQRGARITVTVTGERDGYETASATSAPTDAVAAGATTPGRPVVSGTAEVGVALSLDRGTWAAGTTLSQQWFRDGTPVVGATGTTFTPTSSERGARISVVVTGVRDGYETATATSTSTSPVLEGTLRAATPKVSGTPKVGRRLSVTRGTWTSGTSFSYRWLANGRAIKGATRSTFVVPRSVKGKRISVRVTGRKSGYTTVTRTSARTGTVR